MKTALIAASGLTLLMAGTALAVGGGGHGADLNFPPSLASYDDADFEGISQTLSHRVDTAPFNLVATLIFLCAIIHTFLTSKFLEISHSWAHHHAARIVRGERVRGGFPAVAPAVGSLWASSRITRETCSFARLTNSGLTSSSAAYQCIQLIPPYRRKQYVLQLLAAVRA